MVTPVGAVCDDPLPKEGVTRGWIVTDLSTRPGQALGFGNPVSYLFAGQGTQHCVMLEFSATSQAINHALIEWEAHPGDPYDAIGLMIGVDVSAGRVQSGGVRVPPRRGPSTSCTRR